jgi:predicted enzyme related to lactoylglutathione lyase
MTSILDLFTIDTPRPARLAEFWCAVLGLNETEREDGDRWIVLADCHGMRRIGLQRGVHRAGGIHLDLACAVNEFDNEVDRLVGLGAQLHSPVRSEPYGRIANLSDIDGNAFDLCAYRHDTYH